jgi:hypothetical protein
MALDRRIAAAHNSGSCQRWTGRARRVASTVSFDPLHSDQAKQAQLVMVVLPSNDRKGVRAQGDDRDSCSRLEYESTTLDPRQSVS